MSGKRKSPRIPERIWEMHKPNILRLYLSENRPLIAPGGVRDIMRTEHNFLASKSQYETILKRWSCYKYTSVQNRRTQPSLLNSGRVCGPRPGNESRNLTIRIPSPHHPDLHPAPHGPPTSGRSSSGLARGRHDMSSISEASVALQFSTFRCEINSFAHQNQTWPSTAVLDESGIFNPAWVFPDNLPSRTTDLLSDLAIPDFAASMIPVISRMFPRALSPAHMVLFDNSTAVESAIINISHPSALPLLSKQSIDHQIMYIVLHHLINHDDVVCALENPETEFDHFFKAGIKHCFSLGPSALINIIKFTPTPYDLALVQSVFRAALYLGDGSILNGILSMDPGSLVNRSVLLGESHYYPLEYTSIYGHVQATEALLDHGADPNRQVGESLLFCIGTRPWSQELYRSSRVHILRLLIGRGLEIDTDSAVRRMEVCTLDELMILVTYCLDMSFEVFFIHQGLPTVLLREIWDDSLSGTITTVTERALSDSIGHQAFWESVLSESLSGAVLHNHTSAVGILLAMGAKPNVHCLISAVQSNDLRLVETFMKCGVDPNARRSEPYTDTTDGYGTRLYYQKYQRDKCCTALGESIKNRSSGAFEMLEEQGYILELADQPIGFVSAFVAACHAGNGSLIEQLLALQSFPGRLEGIEEALETAMEEGQLHIIDRLLSVGIKPTIRSLELAIEKKQLTTLNMLADCLDLAATIDMDIRNGKMPTYREGGRYYNNVLLFEALRWGNRTAIELMLSLQFPVNALFRTGYKPPSDWNLDPGLHMRGFEDSWHLTPLSAAILKDNTAAVNDLMAYGTQAVLFYSRPTSYRNDFWAENRSYSMILTPLTAASMKNDLVLVKELLRIGADPFDNSALFVCAVLDLLEISTVLLYAFKIRYPDGARDFGCDALFEIIRRKNSRLFRLFAADINLSGPVVKGPGPAVLDETRFQSSTVWTSPLGEAIRLHSEGNGADGMLDFLLSLVKSYDTVVHRDYKRGYMTCLLSAIFLGSLKTVQKLHQAGANIILPATGSLTWTPLQAAAQVASKEIVEYLLGQGVSPNESPCKRGGATALQLAAISGNINITTILLEAGANINAAQAFCDGRTAFEGATEHGRIEMMKFLVGKGADLLANDNEQYRRAIVFAEDNRQYAAKALADELHARVVASQQTSFIDMGGQWAGSEMPDFGTLFS